MMKVTAVSNGVVIDHITAGKCMKLYQFLDLDHVDATIALIKNAPSQKMGKKDIIKIDTELELDLDALAILTQRNHQYRKGRHLCEKDASAAA